MQILSYIHQMWQGSKMDKLSTNFNARKTTRTRTQSYSNALSFTYEHLCFLLYRLISIIGVGFTEVALAAKPGAAPFPHKLHISENKFHEFSIS